MSYFAEQKDQVFKTITGDNCSEFTGLSLIEDGTLKVYFTHPYAYGEGKYHQITGELTADFLGSEEFLELWGRLNNNNVYLARDVGYVY